ncbi:uncharacterized protein LOC134750216 [Cydia strobilella]|uniref:uncharacterized protein LOC134750216 n=1 Tax=Cydia strobilella TaxID=1100964 RepID=UPI0030059CC2
MVEAIQDACINTIPLKGENKKAKSTPWWTEELGSTKTRVETLRRRVAKANPARRGAVYAEYAEKTPALECLENGSILGELQSAQLLTNTFFPPDDPTVDQEWHKKIREEANEIQRAARTPPQGVQLVPFTGDEADQVLKGMNPSKAPGTDGLTLDICHRAFLTSPTILALFNQCLRLLYFPKCWKETYIRVIPKPSKEDYGSPWILVDIEGAFDEAWCPIILRELNTHCGDQWLMGIVSSYLEDSNVTLSYLGETVRRRTEGGCIQVSIGGPLLWNLQLDPLLREAEGGNAQLQAFADDIVIMARANTTEELNRKVNDALEMVAR